MSDNNKETARNLIFGTLVQEDIKYVEIAKDIETKIVNFVTTIVADDAEDMNAVKICGFTLAILTLQEKLLDE